MSIYITVNNIDNKSNIVLFLYIHTINEPSEKVESLLICVDAIPW